MANQEAWRPRIGVTWRTANEEASNTRAKMANYLRAVELAGGQPVLISLMRCADGLKRAAAELDGFLLTGSPADVDPAHFHAKRHSSTADADSARERTDFTLFEHALAVQKPVLAICYGLQSLNVFLGGSLIQDIAAELGSSVCHSSKDEEAPSERELPDAIHHAQVAPGRILKLSDAPCVEVASSHHQSILEPGADLRITAHAPDGVVEAVEWTGDANWVVGVQWHPERMPHDPLAHALFRELVHTAAAAKR